MINFFVGSKIINTKHKTSNRILSRLFLSKLSLMDRLIRDLLPTAPDLGLFAAPDIPPKKLAAAIGDYARDVRPEAVLALYDATRLGSAKDGALFLADRLVFQNNDFSATRTVRYDDLVGVRQTRSLLGGRAVEMDLNRARATVTEALDVSAHAGAAEYVERFLHEAMLGATRTAADPAAAETDVRAITDALDAHVREGTLAADDRRRMLAALTGRR